MIEITSTMLRMRMALKTAGYEISCKAALTAALLASFFNFPVKAGPLLPPDSNGLVASANSSETLAFYRSGDLHIRSHRAFCEEWMWKVPEGAEDDAIWKKFIDHFGLIALKNTRVASADQSIEAEAQYNDRILYTNHRIGLTRPVYMQEGETVEKMGLSRGGRFLFAISYDIFGQARLHLWDLAYEAALLDPFYETLFFRRRSFFVSDDPFPHDLHGIYPRAYRFHPAVHGFEKELP